MSVFWVRTADKRSTARRYLIIMQKYSVDLATADFINSYSLIWVCLHSFAG